MVQWCQLPKRPLCRFPKATWAEIGQMTDWPPFTALCTLLHYLHRHAFWMISPAHTIHHIGTCFTSSMMPHQDPGSVLCAKAQRESALWQRGLDFSPCTAQQVNARAMSFSLRVSFILEFASCLTLGPLKRKAMLPGGKSRARIVHASSYVPRSSSSRWPIPVGQNCGGTGFFATSIFLDQVWLLALGLDKIRTMA